MENLVSHEAMVKEIKNLCWDNRYREGMTVEHLAEELDALAEDFDPYEYRDNLLGDDIKRKALKEQSETRLASMQIISP